MVDTQQGFEIDAKLRPVSPRKNYRSEHRFKCVTGRIWLRSKLASPTGFLHQDMTRQVVVIEHAADPKKAGAQVFSHPRDLSHALDSDFLGSLVWRRDQNLNSDVRSSWWAPATQNQCTVQRDVGGEAPFGVLHPVVPMEDNGQPQFVSHGSSALEDWTWGRHGRSQNRQIPAWPQDAECWEIYEPTEVLAQRRLLYARLGGRPNILASPETPPHTAIEKKVWILEKLVWRNWTD
jgi:hypothetical protein